MQKNIYRAFNKDYFDKKNPKWDLSGILLYLWNKPAAQAAGADPPQMKLHL